MCVSRGGTSTTSKERYLFFNRTCTQGCTNIKSTLQNEHTIIGGVEGTINGDVRQRLHHVKCIPMGSSILLF
jgi:hypothetical protein